METIHQKIVIVGIVGPCASGKTTLISALHWEGVQFRHIAQEHSYVPTMWRRLTNPAVLIYLDASYEVTCKRRRLNWTEAEYQEQKNRLSHARENADLYILTDYLTPQDVIQTVKDYLSMRGIIQQ